MMKLASRDALIGATLCAFLVQGLLAHGSASGAIGDAITGRRDTAVIGQNGIGGSLDIWHTSAPAVESALPYHLDAPLTSPCQCAQMILSNGYGCCGAPGRQAGSMGNVTLDAPSLSPRTAGRGADLTCTPQNVQRPENETVVIAYEWLRDGARFASTILPDPDLVLYLPFDDRGNLGSDFAKDNDATMSGVQYSANGVIGGAAEFSSYADYIEVAGDPSLDISGPFSIEAWVQSYEDIADVPPDRETFVIAQGSNGPRLYYMGGEPHGAGGHRGWNAFAVSFSEPDGNRHWDAGWTDWVPKDVWIHVVGVYDNSKIIVYRNGAATQIVNNVLGARTVDGSGAVTINKNGEFRGLVDEVAVYRRALSPDEVRGHYVAGYWGGSLLKKRFLQKGDTWQCGTTPMTSSAVGASKVSVEVTIAGNSREQDPVVTPYIEPIEYHGQPFFPIFIWLGSKQIMAEYVAVGINAFLGSPGGSDWNDMALDHGINVFGRTYTDDPHWLSIGGWLMTDEPECAPASLALPERLQRMHDRARAHDPRSRPTLTNHCSAYHPHDDDFWAERLEAADLRKWYSTSDILSWTAEYPSNKGHPERSYQIGPGTAKLGLLSDFEKPYMAIIEATDIHTEDDNPAPTPRAMRLQAWSSIIHGARALGYFTHSFDDGTWIGYFTTSETLKQEMARTNRQIAALAEVIWQPPAARVVTAVEADDRRVDFMVRAHHKKTYIFAVNADEQMRTEKVIFYVEGLKAGTHVEIYEEGSLLADDGSFSTFFKSQDSHIFVIGD